MISRMLKVWRAAVIYCSCYQWSSAAFHQSLSSKRCFQSTGAKVHVRPRSSKVVECVWSDTLSIYTPDAQPKRLWVWCAVLFLMSFLGQSMAMRAPLVDRISSGRRRDSVDRLVRPRNRTEKLLLMHLAVCFYFHHGQNLLPHGQDISFPAGTCYGNFASKLPAILTGHSR